MTQRIGWKRAALEQTRKPHLAEGPNIKKGKASMSSHSMSNPNGGVPVRRVVEPPDPNDHLLERILDRNNMRSAWKRVKANKGAAGVDKMSVNDFESHARHHWPDIRQSLLSDTYQPLPVLRVEIPKSTGGMRPLVGQSLP